MKQLFPENSTELKLSRLQKKRKGIPETQKGNKTVIYKFCSTGQLSFSIYFRYLQNWYQNYKILNKQSNISVSSITDCSEQRRMYVILMHNDRKRQINLPDLYNGIFMGNLYNSF